MATQAGIAYVTIAYDPAAVEKLRAETRAQGQAVAQSWSQTGKKIGQGLSSVGSTLTRNLTLPLVGAGYAATKYAYGFEQSLNHIQALVGANTKQMDYYKKSIIALSPAVGQGPTELADALYFITSSGFKGAKALDVLKASAKGAASGLGDTKTIADLVTSAINVYGQKNLSAAHAVDILTQAVKDGKGEPAQYATAMGRVIPVAQNLGVSFDQVGAALAALTLGGFSADKATTGLQSIFTNLEKPSKSAQAALKGVGLSAGQIREEIKTKGLLPALLDLNKAFDGNGVALRQVFTNGKAIVPFLSLTGQAAQKNVGIFNDLANSTGASEKAFATQSQTTAFQMQQALAKIQVAAVQVGGVILPIFADLSTKAADLTTKFTALPQGFQEIAIGALAGGAALGPLFSILGNVTKGVLALRDGLLLLTGAEKLATVGAAGLGGAFVIIASIAALAAYGISQANQATYPTAGLFKDAATNVNGLAGAFRNLQNATSEKKDLLLQQKQDVLGVKDAHQALTDYLTHGGKRGTLEYQHLILNLRQAEQNLHDANVNVKQSTLDHTNALNKYRGMLKDAKDATKKLNDEIGSEIKLYQAFGNQSTQHDKIIQQYSDGMKNLSDREQTAADNLKKLGDNAGSKLAHKLAVAAQWAGALASSLGRIPTHVDVQVAIQGARIDAARGEGTNKYGHAMGGIFPSGIRAHAGGGLFTAPTLVGRDLFGEAGREAVVPLDSKYGRHTLAEALREAGLGGTPDVKVFVGNEPVDARVEVALKRTARRLQAGRKWSIA